MVYLHPVSRVPGSYSRLASWLQLSTEGGSSHSSITRVSATPMGDLGRVASSQLPPWASPGFAGSSGPQGGFPVWTRGLWLSSGCDAKARPLSGFSERFTSHGAGAGNPGVRVPMWSGSSVGSHSVLSVAFPPPECWEREKQSLPLASSSGTPVAPCKPVTSYRPHLHIASQGLGGGARASSHT